MTGAELAQWRRQFHLSQQALAKTLGVHVITVTRWETEARAIPPFLPLALKTIEREQKKSSKK